MLDSALGIRLLFLVGDTLPLPPPVDVAMALTKVEVTNDVGGPDGFQLTLSCQRGGAIDFPLLERNVFGTHTRVVLAMVFGVLPDVLINGVVTQRQFSPGNSPGEGILTVTGRDLTVLMDLEEKNETYDNQPDGVIATRVLAGYASNGVIPQATQTTDVPIVTERTPSQHETDLKFLQRMAQRNGFVFYLDPIAPGVTRANWGPETRGGMPQAPLNVQMGSTTNVRSINFTGDDQAAVGTRGVIVEPNTRMTIPIPSLPSLKIPPLVAMPAQPVRTRVMRESASQNAASAAVSAVAAATNAPDTFGAQGDLDGVRYGRVLRARQSVYLRGAGWNHDGVWFVRRVTHTVQRGSYTQNFNLSREGRGSLIPMVPPI